MMAPTTVNERYRDITSTDDKAPPPSQPPTSSSVSNTTMRWPRPIVMVITALLSLLLSAAASPCPSQNKTASPDSKPHRATQAGKDQSELCDKTNAKQQVEPQTSGEVSWDPVVDWDSPNPREVVAFFFVGLVLCAPIFLLIRRVRTRKRESAGPRRFLER
jgi:hypothetical protein